MYIEPQEFRRSLSIPHTEKCIFNIFFIFFLKIEKKNFRKKNLKKFFFWKIIFSKKISKKIQKNPKNLGLKKFGNFLTILKQKPKPFSKKNYVAMDKKIIIFLSNAKKKIFFKFFYFFFKKISKKSEKSWPKKSGFFFIHFGGKIATGFKKNRNIFQ